jgi:hypothetical protein
MQPRVAGQDLPGGTSGWVAFEHDRDIFTQAGKHARILTFPTDSLKY